MNEWRLIKTYRRRNRIMHQVDLWMQWRASPLTMGIADAFRVSDAWQDRDGKWFHYDRPGVPAELNIDYITHWMPRPSPPRERC